MITRFKNYFSKRYMPRWLVLLFDLYIVWITLLMAYILRFNFDIQIAAEFLHYQEMVVAVIAYALAFYLLRSYSGILRQSTTEDIIRILLAMGIGSGMLLMFSFLLRQMISASPLLVPYSIIIIHFTVASHLLLLSRIMAKGIYTEWFIKRDNVKNIMIYGTGSLGEMTRNVLMSDNSRRIRLIGFIDNNIFLQHKRLAGIPIYSVSRAFKKIIPKSNISEIIIAIDNEEVQPRLKREIVDKCLPFGILVKEVPSVNKWLNGELSPREIKAIKIEDLLSRDTIKLDRDKIKQGVKEAVVLVAGAAGSIGSEIVNQLILFQAHHVILLDKAESDLYDLQNQIIAQYSNPRFTVIVGDVTNAVTLRKVFEQYSPTMVINAAAYKHVPLMEQYPCEAVRVNVGGTKILSDLSVEYGVRKFVFISTDKAVNPSNVMGASKRISEIYVQSLAQNKAGGTQFITTRFGNVLGSNGSVVPLFKKQIENGGPVTVTHKDITRFFMTIPEACQLVLDACFMGNGGEIYVFDMGEPVKIYNLAEKMILLSGLVPNRDINIEITNLRPGEKLYEELLDNKEDLLPTYNDKILIGKVRQHDHDLVSTQINDLLSDVDEMTSEQLVAQMMEIVPEFTSLNSYYTKHGPSKNGGTQHPEMVEIEE
jgi:FlaA1/EpsC-like NDP-sugar epimerase